MARKSRRKRRSRRIHREKISGKEVDLRREYPYVMSDLKRLAILAGAMLALLIVLSFVVK